MFNRGRFRASAQSGFEYSTLTLDIIRSTTVIDMLGPITLDYRKFIGWSRQRVPFTNSDFDKLRASGISVLHTAVGFTQDDIHASSLYDISASNAFISMHSDQFHRVDGWEDLGRVKELGKIGIVIGQQNSAHFRTERDVDFFYDLGQRVSQLTYNGNRLGGGSSDSSDRGLTEFGACIVARMNRVGMAVDVSHCGDRTTLEAISASRKPVLITHSNCRALVPASQRCKTDDAIRRLASRGGVFGVTMIRSFVRSNGPATIENMLDHVEHIARLTSLEHVGIGTDVDLDGHDPRLNLDLAGIACRKKIFDITEGLVRRKYGADQIRLILGGNFARVLSEIWTS
jgi:membrane dipeptidase